MIALKEFFKKNKLWLSPAIFLIFVGLAVYLIVFHLLVDIRSKADGIQQRIIDNEISQKRVEKLPDIKKNIEAIVARQDSLDVILDERRELDFIRKIEGIAEQTSNRIDIQIKESSAEKTKTPAKGSQKDEILGALPYDKYLMIEIAIEGNYQQLVNFIHKFENFDYYVNIVSLKSEKLEEEFEDPSGQRSANKQSEQSKGHEFIRTTINTVVYLKK